MLPTRKPDEPFLLGANDVLQHSLIYDSFPFMALLFEWDAAKARTNLKKHGVAFEEATTIFAFSSIKQFSMQDTLYCTMYIQTLLFLGGGGNSVIGS